MIDITDNLEEVMAMLNRKESDFEHAIESVENALAHGRTGEQELNFMDELARDLAELAEQISDQIQKKLESL
jgi:hypothetical protein